MTWQPLLEGAASEAAREGVRAILADLESWGRSRMQSDSRCLRGAVARA